MRHERITELRHQMADAGVDAVVMWPSSNWRHLCFAPVAEERLCLLITTQDRLGVVLPVFDVKEMTENLGEALIVGWSDDQGPERALREVWNGVGGPGLRTIAVDDGIPYRFMRLLLPHAEGAVCTSLSASLPRYRLVKDDQEIEAIRTTAQIIEGALDQVPGILRPGMSELELERSLKAALLAEGAETLDYTLVQFGANSAIPHHMAGTDTLERGSNVLFDIAVTRDRYFADITRNVVLGEPSRAYREVFDVVRAAQQAGVDAVAPGVTVHDVDRMCREVIDAAGFGAAFFTRTGHGLGLDVHEPPSVVAENRFVLEAGMVVTVEPGIYLAGEFGVRIEDTVAVRETGGADRLTGSNRDLVIAV